LALVVDMSLGLILAPLPFDVPIFLSFVSFFSYPCFIRG
jgi:hypothetical protein